MYASFCLSASSRYGPSTVSTPAASSNSLPPPGDFGIGVPRGDKHPRHARLYYRPGAGRGTPVVAAGLKSHVHRRACRQAPRGIEGVHLGMRSAAGLVEPLPDHGPVPDQNGSDQRVRTRPPPPFFRQFKRPQHVSLFVGAGNGHGKPRKAHLIFFGYKYQKALPLKIKMRAGRSYRRTFLTRALTPSPVRTLTVGPVISTGLLIRARGL